MNQPNKMEIKIGQQIKMNKNEKGYWVNLFEGEVTGIKEGKVRVKNYRFGNRWYSIKNIHSI